MLVLKRTTDEEIHIETPGGTIVLHQVFDDDSPKRIGITAPKDFQITRKFAAPTPYENRRRRPER